MALHLAIQDAILTEIARPEFSAALPPLSDKAWRSIVGNTPQAHKENERLEFLGDAMMYAALGHHLYTQIPDGTPGLFTEVRAALHSNLTFSRLAEKLDIFAVSDYVLKALTARTFGEGTSAPEKTKGHVKATADLFETVIGSYYLERGYQALCSWVDDLYCPLVVAGRRAYGDNLRLRSKHGPRMPPKKVYSPMKPVQVVVKSKRTILKHPLTNKPILANSSKTSRPYLGPHRSTFVAGKPGFRSYRETVITPRRPAQKLDHGVVGNSRAPAVAVKAKSVFIDLTGLEDSDMEASPSTVPSTSAQKKLQVTAAVKSSVESMDNSESDDDSMQDFVDEQFLENMLITSSRTPP